MASRFADSIRYQLMGLARRLVRRFPVLRRLQHLQPSTAGHSVPTLYGVPAPQDAAAIDRRLPPRVRLILQQLEGTPEGSHK